MFCSGTKLDAARGIDDDAAAGETLADVVVGVAFEGQRQALRDEGAEALAGRALEGEADGVVGQARRVRSGGVISLPRMVPTTRLRLRMGSVAETGSFAFDGGRAQRRAASSCRATPRGRGPAGSGSSGPTSGPTSGRWKMAEKSRPRAFQWSRAGFISRHSLRPTISSRRRKPSEAISSRTFLGDELHEGHDVAGVARELLAQARVLVATPTGQVLRVADAHHDAAEHDQGRGGEAELLGAEQRRPPRRRGRS